jgi:hypothetical protein
MSTQNRGYTDTETPRRRQDDPGSTNSQPGLEPDDQRSPRKNPSPDSPNRPEDLPEQKLSGSKGPNDKQQNQRNQERPNQGGGDRERTGQQSGNPKQGQERSGKH